MRIINTASYVNEQDLFKLSDNDREAMYNGLDCCVTAELFDILLGELDEVSRTTYQLSCDLRAPILEMSLRGIRVDETQRKKVVYNKTIEREFVHENLQAIAREGLGMEFNYRSPIALQNLFYKVLDLKPIRKRNAAGKFVPTVNRDALERLQIHYWAVPFCLHIIKLRELDKQLEFLRTGIDPDGRMRSTFNIAGTNTGRLASSMSEFGTGTNMQNIDRGLRTILIPDPGMKFINIDLEQGDSRNMGAMMWNCFYKSHGEAFAGSYLNACESADLHTMVARMTWQDLPWPEDETDVKAMRAVADKIFYRLDSYRQTGKKLGHGSNYGGQAPTMAMHTKMPRPIIEQFQYNYFKAFPCIPEYHVWVKQQLQDYSSLTTLYKRRRYFFGRVAEPKTVNEAIAFPSQSMTADAVNHAMINLFKKTYSNNNPAFRNLQLLCQVHDSLLYQIPENEVDDVIPELLATAKIHLTLAGDRSFAVPNEAKVGWNWGDADPDENPHGLLKYKGEDTRIFIPRKKLSILEHKYDTSTSPLAGRI